MLLQATTTETPMLFDEIRNRYGSQLAVRIIEALPPKVIDDLEVDELATTLQTYADKAYQNYCHHLDNTPIQAVERTQLTEALNNLRQKWQEAEELAYHILDIELKVSQTARRTSPGV